MPYDMPTPIWSFSILVDVSGRVEELRGDVSENLGRHPHEFADSSIMELVAPDDRELFLRHYGQLGGAELPPPVVVRLTHAQQKPRAYVVQFERGPSLRANWLMFIETDPGQSPDGIPSAPALQ